VEGFSNVSDIAGNFSYGIYRNLQLFASFKFDTRVDATCARSSRRMRRRAESTRTILVHETWTGDHVGDLTVGLKIGLLSEEQQKPVAAAACDGQASDGQQIRRRQHRQGRRVHDFVVRRTSRSRLSSRPMAASR